MRNVARLKMGYYPLPESEGVKLRALLSFTQPASVIDPCVGQGTALHLVTSDAEVRRYGVELDAERARIAGSRGIETIQGNTFDAIARPESFSLLYLNPPYDSEIGSIANRRMEAVFLEHTYRWLVAGGILVLVIPFERLHDCAGLLSSHFAQLNVFRMTDEASVQYRQIAVLGVRSDVRGATVENNKRQLQKISPYGSFQVLPELRPDACPPYPVPPSGEVALSYRGLPYDLLEDLLPLSGAWKQSAPFLTPHEDVATGRPITPLHGGHVGLLCTAGLLNGVFGQGDARHIARWRPVKHVTTFTEEDGDTEIVLCDKDGVASVDRNGIDGLQPRQWSSIRREVCACASHVGNGASGLYLPLKEGDWREETAKIKKYLIQADLTDFFEDYRLENFDRIILQTHLNQLAKTRSKDRVLQIRAYVRDIFAEAVDQGFLSKDPARKLKPPVNLRATDKTVLTWDHLAAAVEKLDLRDRILLRLDITNALRPGELFAPRWKCHHVETLSLSIVETVYKGKIRPYGKTKGSLREVPISEDVSKDLVLWRKVSQERYDKRKKKRGLPPSDEEAFIFPGRFGSVMDPSNYRNRVLHKLAEDLGLPKLTFQVIRRTTATLAQKKGTVKDVQGVMGHTRLATTTDVYMQTIPESVRATVDSLDRELQLTMKKRSTGAEALAATAALATAMVQ